MLSLAIYSNIEEDILLLKSIVQDFLIESKIIAKVSVFNNPEEFATVAGSYDIYIMDMDSEDDVVALGSCKMEVDIGSHFIYMCSDTSLAY